MRGKVIESGESAAIMRITPAYAGKSTSVQDRSCEHEDHPRLCGEKAPETVYHIKEKGSPPPMRGKAAYIITSALQIGITPAYAGKRGVFVQQMEALWDHPRLCGEKSLLRCPAG